MARRKVATAGMRFKVAPKEVEKKPTKGKEPRYYPAEDLPKKSKHPKPTANVSMFYIYLNKF